MTTSDDAMLKSDASFKDLLGRATPRPVPTSDEVNEVRQAVLEEWQVVTRKHRTRRRLVSLAAAATLLLTVGLLVNTTQTPTVMPVLVASIDKSVGAIYVLGAQSVLQQTADLADIAVGQTIKTGKQSSLGLAWGTGGSLRVAASSVVRFVSADAIELESGTIYFDSERAGVASASKLMVQTEYGLVSHRGTQYMTQLDDMKLTVSVREGRVSIDGLHYDRVVLAGEQLQIAGNTRPVTLDITGYGANWEWIEATAPIGKFDGKTVYEFLQWVARETGLNLHYVDDAVEGVVKDEENILTDEVDADPRAALRQRMRTMDLDFKIDNDNGFIIISDSRK